MREFTSLILPLMSLCTLRVFDSALLKYYFNKMRY